MFHFRHQIWIRNAFNCKYPKTQIAVNFSNFLLPLIYCHHHHWCYYNSKVSLLTCVLNWSVVLIKLHSTFSFPSFKPGITNITLAITANWLITDYLCWILRLEMLSRRECLSWSFSDVSHGCRKQVWHVWIYLPSFCQISTSLSGLVLKVPVSLSGWKSTILE